MPLYTHFYRTVQDLQGNVVPEVMGTITLAGTSTLATLYGDPAGVTPLPNPLANDAEYGSFSVYLDSGHYDMTFAKVNYVFEPLEDILIADATGGVVSLVGTPNRVLVSSSFGDVVLSSPQNTDPDATIQFAHLGLGAPGSAGHGLWCETYSEFRNIMAAMDINSSGRVMANEHYVPDHPGNTQVAFHTHLNAAGGTNRWAFYSGGTAPSYMAANLTVMGSVNFGGTLTVSSNAAVNGSLAVTGSVTSPSFGGFSLGVSCGAQSAPPPPRKLDVWGEAYVSGLLTGAGIIRANRLESTTWVTAAEASIGARVLCYRLGISGGDPGTTYALYSAGGSHYIAGLLGVNVAPGTGGYQVSVNNLHSSGALYSTTEVNAGTLNVRGGSQFNSTIGVNYAADPGYWMRIPSIWADTLRATTSSVDGNLNVAGNGSVNGNFYATIGAFGIGPQAGYYLSAANLYISATSVLTGQVQCVDKLAVYRAPEPGYWLTAQNAYFNTATVGANLLVYSITATQNGYKPGGGVWADSSSRTLKRNIQRIPNALPLLLEQRGCMYEWDEPTHAALLPGTRYGLVAEEVTLPQWHTRGPDGGDAIAAQGFEALCIEGLREIVTRLEALEAQCRVTP